MQVSYGYFLWVDTLYINDVFLGKVMHVGLKSYRWDRFYWPNADATLGDEDD